MYLAAAEPGWHTAMLACWQGFQLISYPAMEPYWFGSCKPVGCASLHRMPFDGAEKPLELAHSLFCLDLIMKMLVILCKIIAFGVSTVLPSHSQGKKKRRTLTYCDALRLLWCSYFSFTFGAISPVHSTLTTQPRRWC